MPSNNDYEIDFRKLKSRVGIDDVAYSLGYRLDRKAGVGKYIELVFGDGHNKRDTIIVSHPNDKASQTFFRRDGSKGDVITLIKENINSFNVSGNDEWHKVAKVLAKFANMPEPKYREDREFVKKSAATASFEPSRYEVRQIESGKIPYILAQRGFSQETVERFAPFISLIRDKNNRSFEGYNIGFPYTKGNYDNVAGYEIRGTGSYKSKAAGTDSSSASWVANLSGNGDGLVSNIFFCESAFDAMAFYQINRLRIGNELALVSLGGTFSDKQIKNVLERFPGAKAYDCFDNDLAGRINAMRLIGLVEKISLKFNKKEDAMEVVAGNKSVLYRGNESVKAFLSKNFGVKGFTGEWNPPKSFKDWNDCLLGKTMQYEILPNKNDRDRNLAENRKSSMKL